jgi:hypothetical protein
MSDTERFDSRNPLLSRTVVVFHAIMICAFVIYIAPFSVQWSSTIPNILTGIVALIGARGMKWQLANMLYYYHNINIRDIAKDVLKSTVSASLFLLIIEHLTSTQLTGFLEANPWLVWFASSLLIGFLAAPFYFTEWSVETGLTVIAIIGGIIFVGISKSVLLLIEGKTVTYSTAFVGVLDSFILTVLAMMLIGSISLVINPHFDKNQVRNSFRITIENELDQKMCNRLAADISDISGKYQEIRIRRDELSTIHDTISDQSEKRWFEYPEIQPYKFIERTKEYGDISNRIENISQRSQIKIYVEEDIDLEEDSRLEKAWKELKFRYF